MSYLRERNFHKQFHTEQVLRDKKHMPTFTCRAYGLNFATKFMINFGSKMSTAVMKFEQPNKWLKYNNNNKDTSRPTTILKKIGTFIGSYPLHFSNNLLTNLLFKKILKTNKAAK